MPILVTCPCGSQLRARDDQVGRQCRCPGCGSILTVPAPALPDAPPVIVETEAAPPIQLGYADTDIGRRADPLIHGGGAKPLPVIARASQDVAKLENTWRGKLWWMLLVLMIPLLWVSLQTAPRPTLKERIERTLAKNPTTHPDFGSEEHGYEYLDQGISELPGQRLDGAFLSIHSVFPLLFAMIAAAGFVLLSTYAIPSDSPSVRASFLSGLFTATGGVLLLLGIQSFHLFCCIQAFYLAAEDPSAPFGASLIGFVLGVGVCEEVIKCLPILFLMWRGMLMNWRTACVIGMASGAGFGVSEAILYSFRYYNGIEPGDAYLLRFTSCIAFHTLLSGACAMLIQRKQEHLLEKSDPINWTLTLMAIILIPIFLHGLFDTYAKKEMELGALGVAIGSFVWLAVLINLARRREQSVAVALPAGPKIIKTAKGTRFIGPAPTPVDKRRR